MSSVRRVGGSARSTVVRRRPAAKVVPKKGAAVSKATRPDVYVPVVPAHDRPVRCYCGAGSIYGSVCTC